MHVLWLSICAISILFSKVSLGSTAHGTIHSLDTVPVLHFTLSRRGGVFSATEPEHDWVNLKYLAHQLNRTEWRFGLTRREAKGNKLIRKAKLDKNGGQELGSLMGEIAAEGTWFNTATLRLKPDC